MWTLPWTKLNTYLLNNGNKRVQYKHSPISLLCQHTVRPKVELRWFWNWRKTIEEENQLDRTYVYLDYKDLVHLAIMYLTFSKWCICSKKQGIRSKSLLVASLSKSIFLTPGSSFPKGISIWRIMSVSHQSCPFLFPVILMHLQKGQYLSKNIGLNKCESRIYS